ncbi:MAG: septal ring lytic transglycosylase RlpA family protein [Gammaproteobacteria bacterium]|nr:septal ring lytic transglycosylase RlpA family protein [Gammaproteobacteria bacterium]
MIVKVFLTGLVVMLASCSLRDSAPKNFNKHADSIRNAVPANEPKSRYGNPDSYTVMGKTYHVRDSSQGFVQSGDASWYGTKFHGRKTSSGEPYNMYAMTAAHKTLPLPTYVEVRHRENGRKVIVKVNDRGPFHPGRIIDLSYAAATKLGISGTGTGPVEIRAINTGGMDLDTSSVVLPEGGSVDGKIHVQVAAMGSEQAAEQVATDLRSKSFNSVRINVVEADGKKLYRVRIGPIPDVDLAYRVLRNLNDAGLDTARVVVD